MTTLILNDGLGNAPDSLAALCGPAPMLIMVNKLKRRIDEKLTI